jgi:hypothetical protein
MPAQQSHATELARLSPLAREQLRQLGDVRGESLPAFKSVTID